MGWYSLAQRIQFISKFDYVFNDFIYPGISILKVYFYRFYRKMSIENVYYIVQEETKQ